MEKQYLTRTLLILTNIKENSDRENKFRFSLYIPFLTSLAASDNNLAVIMKNPSSASSNVCDMTILKVCNVAYNNGYSGVIVVNLFPMRATKATDIQYFYANPDYEKIMKSNIDGIKKLISGYDVVFAWGRDTIQGRKQYPENYKNALKTIINAVNEVNCTTYFADNCKCNGNICSSNKIEKCHSDICYPLHGLRWSYNSKLIKY
ncbi:MAG: DUF1643 domain-containing protein [Clostridiales bacterium]|nr:DUF1643 domain-containing protein [Clostridiales bacterium]